jgi:hypothetical protein
MLIQAMLLAAMHCQTGSINSPQTGSNDGEEVVEIGQKCKFGLVNTNLECYSPDQITNAPKVMPLPPAVQMFPMIRKLTVVSSTSSMMGDLKCSGTNDHLIIQQAIDNMNVTVNIICSNCREVWLSLAMGHSIFQIKSYFATILFSR